MENLRKVRQTSINLSEAGKSENRLGEQVAGGNALPRAPQIDVVLGLETEKIIYRASSLSSYYTNFPYNIQPWAWEYLNQHPDLLE